MSHFSQPPGVEGPESTERFHSSSLRSSATFVLTAVSPPPGHQSPSSQASPMTLQIAPHTPPSPPPSGARIAAVSNPYPRQEIWDREKKATAQGQRVGRGQGRHRWGEWMGDGGRGGGQWWEAGTLTQESQGL